MVKNSEVPLKERSNPSRSFDYKSPEWITMMVDKYSQRQVDVDTRKPGMTSWRDRASAGSDAATGSASKDGSDGGDFAGRRNSDGEDAGWETEDADEEDVARVWAADGKLTCASLLKRSAHFGNGPQLTGGFPNISGSLGQAPGVFSRKALSSGSGNGISVGDGRWISDSCPFMELVCAVLDGALHVTMIESCAGRDLGMVVLLHLLGEALPLNVLERMGGVLSGEVLTIADCCRLNYIAKRARSCLGGTTAIPDEETPSQRKQLLLSKDATPSIQVAVTAHHPPTGIARSAAARPFTINTEIAKAAAMAHEPQMSLEDLLQLDVAVHNIVGSGSVTTSKLCQQHLAPNCVTQLASLALRGSEMRAEKWAEHGMQMFVESIAGAVQEFMQGSNTATLHKDQPITEIPHYVSFELLRLLADSLTSIQPQPSGIAVIGGGGNILIDLLSDDEPNSSDDDQLKPVTGKLSKPVTGKLSKAELRDRKRRGFTGVVKRKHKRQKKRMNQVKVEDSSKKGPVKAATLIFSAPNHGTAAVIAPGCLATAKTGSRAASTATKAPSLRRRPSQLPLEVFCTIFAFISADSDSACMNSSFLALRSCSKHMRTMSDYARTSIAMPLSRVKPAISYLSVLPHLETVALFAPSSVRSKSRSPTICNLRLLDDVVPSLCTLAIGSSRGHSIRVLCFPESLRPWQYSLRRLELHGCTLTAPPRQIRGSYEIKNWTPDLPGLATLSVTNGRLSHLDLSRCWSLIELYLVGNSLMSHLVLPNTDLLQRLTCSSNPNLLNLDLAGCSHLQSLICTENAKLQSIFLDSCSALEELCVKKNVSLSSMSLLDCSSLQALEFEANTSFESLDLSECDKLQRFQCISNASLVELEFTMQGVQEVQCLMNDKLEVLDLSKCGTLLTLDCRSNRVLENVDVTNCDVLKEVTCSDNSSLPSLDLSGCVLLTELNCTSNRSLEHVNVSDCRSLVTLDTRKCDRLGEVDASSCLALTSHISM